MGLMSDRHFYQSCHGASRLPTSQDLLVPFLGLRVGPLHQAEQDTIDEAVTITALLDGLTRFYNPGPFAASSAAASSLPSSADVAASSSTARHLG